MLGEIADLERRACAARIMPRNVVRVQLRASSERIRRTSSLAKTLELNFLEKIGLALLNDLRAILVAQVAERRDDLFLATRSQGGNIEERKVPAHALQAPPDRNPPTRWFRRHPVDEKDPPGQLRLRCYSCSNTAPVHHRLGGNAVGPEVNSGVRLARTSPHLLCLEDFLLEVQFLCDALSG